MGDTVENCVILKVGAPVGVPASGTKALSLDASGNASLLDSTGAKAAVGGGTCQDDAALTWLSTIADFVAARNASLTRVMFRSTCNTLNGEVEVGTPNTGVAGLARITGSNFLKFRTSSGTAANSFAYLRARSIAVAGGASTFAPLVANCRTTPFAVAMRGIVRAVNNTCQLIMANMTDESTADAFLGVVGATSQTNFSLKIGAGAAVDTGVAIGTLGVTEHDLIIISDGTTLSAYIDQAPVAVASGLSSGAANAAGHPNSYAVNGATTTVVSHEVLQWAAFGV